MGGLGKLKQERGLPLQSHLSENLSEIDWVHGLCPWSSCYGQTYEHFGEMDGEGKVVMAHCNYSTDEEVAILKRHNVFVATCPQSNMQLSSGIAPIRRYLVEGVHVGLGTDVAGGATLSMFRAVADLVGCSKLRWRLVDQNLKPLSTAEALYIATVGGGSFFGKVGSFERGFEVDALVLDDSGIRTPLDCDPAERVERYMYLAEEGGRIVEKYVAGVRVL
jgi:guanine deaminase